MKRLAPLMLALAGCASLCAPAYPQGTPPENEDSRFSFYRAEDGYLRLDGRSGQVSLCIRRPAAGWLCQALPEERAAFDAEIARLQRENATLKKEVLAHDLPLPAGTWAEAPPAGRPGAAPADREGSQIMDVVENVWRRLVAMIVSVQRDLLKRS
jgi:hypothetical protein